MRRWRSQLGMSQEQLAERANLHRTYISDVERGARNLSLESIDKLARALEVSVSQLFYAAEDDSTHPVVGGETELVTILLVEDNKDDVELSLEAFKSFRFTNRVDVVSDGQQALDYVFNQADSEIRERSRHPHVILLDLYLPKVNGLEVLRRIRADKRTRHIPVVVLTASQKDGDMLESRRLGANAYIVKPVDFHGLCAVTPRLCLSWALLKPAAQPA